MVVQMDLFIMDKCYDFMQKSSSANLNCCRWDFYPEQNHAGTGWKFVNKTLLAMLMDTVCFVDLAINMLLNWQQFK